MKKMYVVPEIELISLDMEDVITASGYDYEVDVDFGGIGDIED